MSCRLHNFSIAIHYFKLSRRHAFLRNFYTRRCSTLEQELCIYTHTHSHVFSYFLQINCTQMVQKAGKKMKKIPKMQAHCQCKHKQISFVVYFKIKDHIMLLVVVCLKYENNIPFNQNVYIPSRKYTKIQFNHLHNKKPGHTHAHTHTY